MAVSDNFLLYIVDQLSEVEEISHKKMFGGVGFFKGGKMFGMISGDEVFRLKVDDSNKADYEACGMQPLFMKKKGRSMPYWEVPADVLEDKSVLREWANKAIEIALAKK